MEVVTTVADTGNPEKWACIKDGSVVAAVVSDASFISVLKKEHGWDDVLRYDHLPIPHPHLGAEATVIENQDGSKTHTFQNLEYRNMKDASGNIYLVKFHAATIEIKDDGKSDPVVLSTDLTKEAVEADAVAPPEETPLETIDLGTVVVKSADGAVIPKG